MTRRAAAHAPLAAGPEPSLQLRSRALGLCWQRHALFMASWGNNHAAVAPTPTCGRGWRTRMRPGGPEQADAGCTIARRRTRANTGLTRARPVSSGWRRA